MINLIYSLPEDVKNIIFKIKFKLDLKDLHCELKEKFKISQKLLNQRDYYRYRLYYEEQLFSIKYTDKKSAIAEYDNELYSISKNKKCNCIYSILYGKLFSTNISFEVIPYSENSSYL